jgi:Domain of unknown function (DUF4136)
LHLRVLGDTVKIDSYALLALPLKYRCNGGIPDPDSGEQMKKALVLGLILIGAVSVSGQKVKVGADPAADLTKYKTYAVDRSAPAHNPIINQMITDAVDSALAAKGLKKVEKDADMTVVIFAATDSTLAIANPSWSNARGNASATGMAVGSQSWPVTQGMLVVDIADGHTKDSVWRATATHTLKNGPTGDMAKDAKDVGKDIKKAVEKMFKQFPRPT